MDGCGTHRENFIKKNDLTDKSYSLKELSTISKVPMGVLRKVYNRGIGAYKTQPSSVRLKGSYVKGVDAPMSAKLSKEQWAMARVYSFLDNNPKHDNDLRGGEYDLQGHLEGAGLWDYVKDAMTLPSKIVNEFVNPNSVGRQGVNKAINEVVNPDSIARRRITDVSKGIRKNYPPSSRRVLEKYGNWTIVDLTLRRDPVQSAINTAFNIITLGAWNKAKEAENMDRLFHLGIVATVKEGNQEQQILIEKNEVINIGMPKKIEPDSSFLRVPTPNPPVSLRTFLDKGEARRPGGDFFRYDPFANNCQDFVAVLLVGNSVYTKQARAFVKQNVSSLISRLPSYTHAFARGITDLGGIANVALEGGKSSEGSTPAYPFKTQLEKAGLEPSSYLAEARRRAKEHHYPYKLLGFATDGEHKLVIPDKDGRLSAFGKVGYGDHIIYSHLEKAHKVPSGTADAKRNTFQKSHTKIKGDWASKPFSPNNLALRVLW